MKNLKYCLVGDPLLIKFIVFIIRSNRALSPYKNILKTWLYVIEPLEPSKATWLNLIFKIARSL